MLVYHAIVHLKSNSSVCVQLFQCQTRQSFCVFRWSLCETIIEQWNRAMGAERLDGWPPVNSRPQEGSLWQQPGTCSHNSP